MRDFDLDIGKFQEIQSSESHDDQGLSIMFRDDKGNFKSGILGVVDNKIRLWLYDGTTKGDIEVALVYLIERAKVIS